MKFVVCSDRSGVPEWRCHVGTEKGNYSICHSVRKGSWFKI